MKTYMYDPKFADPKFDYFNNLEWDSFTPARKELFYSTSDKTYTYGTGMNAREYIPKPMDKIVKSIGLLISEDYNLAPYEMCFLNYYEGQHNALGWHADDSDMIDHSRPIAVVSFGAERDLWIKPKDGDASTIDKVRLHNGSLLMMLPGMQSTHFHRIPKHDRPCGPRISLTFRGLK